jgi:hypothetical protein
MTRRLSVTAALAGIAVLGAGAGVIGPMARADMPAREYRLQLAHERPAWRLERAALRRENARLRGILRHSPSVAEALTLASVVYCVSRRSLSAVAWCESTHRPTARNGRYRGLFQQGPMFERTPFGRAGLSVWSPYAAALSTAYTVRREGWQQWECRP